MSRHDLRLPDALEHALHGASADRSASDPLRPPEDWERVVAAVHLALLAPQDRQPPPRLGERLRSLLPPPTSRSR